MSNDALLAENINAEVTSAGYQVVLTVQSSTFFGITISELKSESAAKVLKLAPEVDFSDDVFAMLKAHPGKLLRSREAGPGGG
ncbi:MAG TPA: hypothetical protein VE981_10835 [Planctomycetota bacterium]|nr:hypothetical protein [Planctomycetota bacterium]